MQEIEASHEMHHPKILQSHSQDHAFTTRTRPLVSSHTYTQRKTSLTFVRWTVRSTANVTKNHKRRDLCCACDARLPRRCAASTTRVHAQKDQNGQAHFQRYITATTEHVSKNMRVKKSDGMSKKPSPTAVDRRGGGAIRSKERKETRGKVDKSRGRTRASVTGRGWLSKKPNTNHKRSTAFHNYTSMLLFPEKLLFK